MTDTTKRKCILAIAIGVIAAGVIALLITVALPHRYDWEKDLNLAKYSYPDLGNTAVWTPTMDVDFTAITDMAELNAAGWFPSKHGLRNYEYWCPDMIEFRPGDALVIHSTQTDSYACSSGICPAEGVFTSGIETRQEIAGGFRNVFEQAFGFFEAEVQVPRGGGMWSAFWLQCDGTGQRGKRGKDGSEIDIYESSFRDNPHNAGHAIHYDAYQRPWYQLQDKIVTMPDNLYEGYHRYALMWTPKAYVFFIDGVPTWATAFGGVSRVAEILRLTVEIRRGPNGPYGQHIGSFENSDDGSNDYRIKSVRVWQFSRKK